MTTEELEAMRRVLLARAVPVSPAQVSPAQVAPAPVPGSQGLAAAWAAAWAPSGVDYCESCTGVSSRAGVSAVLGYSDLLGTLRKCRIPAVAVQSHVVGPQVTTYTVELEDGSAATALRGKELNMVLWMGIRNVRLLPAMEGHPGCIGLEIPNSESGVVAYRDILSAAVSHMGSRDKYIPVALGAETTGRPHILPFGSSANPHLLIAGKSGSGKSVAIWTVLASITAMYTPDEVQVFLVDPKQMGYTKWAAMPHLAHPVITEPVDTIKVLSVLARGTADKESPMRSVLDTRSRLLGEYLVDDIAEYNKLVPPASRLPRIIVIIDEYADLMTSTGRARPGIQSTAQVVTELIDRIARLGRSVGIHLVLATQRPTADTMLPSIKAQTTKIGCQMESPVDSRVVFGESVAEGAEKLLGAGDAYVKSSTGLTRVKCALVTPADISALIRDDILAEAIKMAR